MSDEGSSGDTFTEIKEIPHYITMMLLIVLTVFLLVGGTFMLINKRAPIPEVLQEDIVIEQLSSCLAPLHPEFDVPVLGYIAEEKLASAYLSTCITDDWSFSGLHLTSRTTHKLYDYTLPGKTFTKKSNKFPSTLRLISGEEIPVFVEVLFR